MWVDRVLVVNEINGVNYPTVVGMIEYFLMILNCFEVSIIVI